MAKRFATIFFIMIGVVVFLLSAFLMVLFLAPGFNIFGIKYIMVNTHGINTGKENLNEYFYHTYGSSDFSGSIIVNSDEVPIIVQFMEAGWDYHFQYYDNYSGITKSNIDDPSVNLEKDSDGNAVFTINSYDTFLFQNSNSNRYFKLFIPIASVGERGSKSYRTNLIINANTAIVHFSIADFSLTPTFDKLSIKTQGDVYYNKTHIKVKEFIYETDKSINVSSDVRQIINAENYNLTSINGRVVVTKKVSGNITAKTKNGDILINECNNLTAESDLGDIGCSVKDKNVIINGVANIKTNAGAVNIYSIKGSEQNNIETSSGRVNINSIKNGKIKTFTGSINIKSVNDLVITTNMGNVSIEEAIKSIDVTTKRGKINLGAEGMILNSPKATTNLGKINIIDASGDVYIESVSSDVNFVNKSSQNITIYAGGTLNATNLKGVVNLTVAKASYLEFDEISNATKILLKDSCNFLKIDALSIKRTDLNYSMHGNPITIYESNYESNNAGYSSFSSIDSGDYLFNSNKNGISFEIVGDSKNEQCFAKVEIYFARSNI